MRLNRTTGWSLATAGLCVTLATSSWFLLVDPQRAAAAESRELTVAAEQQNAQLEIRIEQLKKEFADLPQRQAELAAIRQALPEEPALAQLIRDTDELAVDAGVVLEALTSGAPVAVVDPQAAVAGAAPPEGEAAGEESSEESAEESSEEPSEEPSEGASAPATDPTAVGGAAVPEQPSAPVLAAVPVTVTARGDFYATTLYLKNLQADMPRAFLVDSFTVSALEGEDVEPGTVETILNGRVFAFVDPTAVDIDAATTQLPSPSDG